MVGERVTDERRLAELLAALAHAFVDGSSDETLLHAVCTAAPAALGVTGAGVMLRAEPEQLQLSTASDERIARVAALQSDLDEGPCRDAFRTGETVREADLATATRWERFGPEAAAAGMRSVVAVPIEHDGERYGTLEAYRSDDPPIDDRQVTATQLVADVTATYLRHLRSVDELRQTSARLRHEALHDPLTGLPNRLLLVDRLSVALAKARRHPWSPTVLFCDLDGFKAVNDRLGHHAGDKLLVAVADRVRQLLRPGDTLARLSGDEFVIVLEDTAESDEAEVVARRVLSALGRPFPLDGGEVRVGASIGIATAGSGPMDALALLRRADAAMYRAKADGGARSSLDRDR